MIRVPFGDANSFEGAPAGVRTAGHDSGGIVMSRRSTQRLITVEIATVVALVLAFLALGQA